MDALYAIHHVPLPAGSRRMAYLHLVPLTEHERQLLDTLLTADAPARLDAVRQLVAPLRAALGEPGLEQP